MKSNCPTGANPSEGLCFSDVQTACYSKLHRNDKTRSRAKPGIGGMALHRILSRGRDVACVSRTLERRVLRR